MDLESSVRLYQVENTLQIESITCIKLEKVKRIQPIEKQQLGCIGLESKMQFSKDELEKVKSRLFYQSFKKYTWLILYVTILFHMRNTFKNY